MVFVVPFSDLVSVSGTLHPVFFPREELLPLFAAELDRAFRCVSSTPVVFVPAQRPPLPVRVDAPTS